MKNLFETSDPYPSLNNCLIGGMGLLCAGFVLWGERMVPAGVVIAFLLVVAALYFYSPYKIDRFVVSFEIIVWTGLLLAIPIEFFLVEIPQWVVWIWLTASIPLSVIFPFPLKTSQYH